MNDHDVCYCGHVRDEHDERGRCDIEDCKCIGFDRDESGVVPSAGTS